MFTKLWNFVDGKKTYVTSALTIVIALVGHFWGPLIIGPGQGILTIPSVGWNGVWTAISVGAFGTSLKSALTKLEGPAAPAAKP